MMVDSLSQATLLWSLLFGAIGTAYFIYGRKQHRPVPFVCGLALMVVPSLMPGLLTMLASAALLAALPYFVSL